MAKTETLALRGASLGAWSGKFGEGGFIHRLKLVADMSRTSAAALGCDEIFFEPDESETLRATGDDREVKGRIAAERFKLKANGLPAVLEMNVTDGEYSCYTVQGKDPDARPVGHIAITLTTTQSMRAVEEYLAIAGTGSGSLRLWMVGASQMKLQDEATDSDTPPADAPKRRRRAETPEAVN